jgi:Kef-type K+ transport system membrane component KefB
MALALVGLAFSAYATEFIGIHALFGAFLFGAIIPRESPLAETVSRKFEKPVVVALLPAYFAFTGLRTQIGLVSGFDQWLVCAVVLLVACAGKFGGAAIAARLSGPAIGILMNTRGLMELIVLNIGLDLGVLSPPLFAMMVLMALGTTLATTPLLALVRRDAPSLAGYGLSDGSASTRSLS